MGDVNKTTHVGTAVTNPSFVKFSNNTPMAIFTLKVKETWVDGQGNKKHHFNLIDFEALGRQSYWVKDNVQAGKRYHIDGYIRSDDVNGVEKRRIRVFHITEEDDSLFGEGKIEGLREGYKRAIAILDSSDSLGSAKAKMEIILKEC